MITMISVPSAEDEARGCCEKERERKSHFFAFPDSLATRSEPTEEGRRARATSDELTPPAFANEHLGRRGVQYWLGGCDAPTTAKESSGATRSPSTSIELVRGHPRQAGFRALVLRALSLIHARHESHLTHHFIKVCGCR